MFAAIPFKEPPGIKALKSSKCNDIKMMEQEVSYSRFENDMEKYHRPWRKSVVQT